jgi:GAG-pre-integrase domain
MADATSLTFPFHERSNLPLMLTEAHCSQQSQSSFIHRAGLSFSDQAMLESLSQRALPTILSSSNLNLSPSQQELLLWHQRLGHADQQHIQVLLSTPRDATVPQILKPRHSKASSCDPVICETCQYAKQRRREPTSFHHTPRESEAGSLSRDILSPGQRVSADQYQSTIRGRLRHTKGREPASEKLVGGAIFADHATGLVFNQHQVGLTAAETVKSKHAFERFADSFALKIQGYATDNHPFLSGVFRADCTHNSQSLVSSGVGAHHQNKAERSIQTIMNWSRALLLHCIIHWPELASVDLWPFAADHGALNVPVRMCRKRSFTLEIIPTASQ